AAREDAEDRQRQLGADTLHCREQAKPLALGGIDEAVEVNMVLAHMGLDEQADGAAGRGQPVEAARRAEHLIADAADIDDGGIGALGIDDARELGDHEAPPAAIFQTRRVAAWWAWQMATASASAASADCSRQPGSRRRTIICTCAFSAWPAPT